MATSQNGWSVLFSAPSGTMKWITGRIRPGDVEVVFNYLCERLNEVEANKQGWSWGWAVRAVRGQVSGYSNHASATAIDYNAPAHPLGVSGTWSEAEKKHINGILAEMDWIIRWGENYTGRKDGMHFEVNKSAVDVARVADKIRNKQLKGQKPAWKPRKAKAVHFGVVQHQFLIAAKAERGKIVRLNGVGLIQQALNRVVGTNLTVDGYCGEATLNAWGKWEERAGGAGRPRVPDRESVEKLANRAGLDIVGEPWDN